MGFSESVLIARPTHEVWTFMTNWSRTPEWMPGIESMRQEGEESPKAGSRLLFQSRGAQRSSEITIWEPTKRLVLRSKQGGVTADYEYRLAEIGDETELTLSAGCQFQGAWKLLSPIISRAMARSDSVQPQRLKEAIENA